MKRVLVMMLVVCVLIGFAALAGVRAQNVEPVSHQDAVLAQGGTPILGACLNDGVRQECLTYHAVAPAPSPPENLAQLASPTCTEEATTATMEQSTPHTNCDLADALDSHVNLRTYDLGRNLDAVKSAPVNIRDHAPC